MDKLRYAGLGAILAVLAGCGGGYSGASTQPTFGLAPGDHLLTFSASAPGGEPLPIAGLKLAFVLPQGVAPPTVPGSPRLQDAALDEPTASGAAIQAAGTFHADTGAVELDLVTAARKAWTGPYLTLRITIPPGATVTPASLRTLAGSFTAYQVAGVDPATHTSRDLSAEVVTTVAVDASPVGKPFHPE